MYILYIYIYIYIYIIYPRKCENRLILINNDINK